MIEGLRDYVIHITATALICSVILHFARGSGSVRMLIKLLCGIVLAYSIIQPMKELDVSKLEGLTFQFREEADRAVYWGENESRTAWVESISQGTEAYILEKAKAMNIDLAVEVVLSEDEIPIPVAVSLAGNVAPYAKSLLSEVISKDLNIPKENQTWISQ